ncbi:flagellar protein FlbA [Candidatus Borreliella tachyglossi]|uniref:Flagellar protein FlbA n=1 Tax=Candidatus Borreliella tachyglossi TaxID=1964448 RepID=A0A2S1LWI9_9SPIR|nr:flagellar protein FlbA [Candidatus Borreliella tachyglossi]AWG42677.1 flagellar protein FlbA [Candidatus Borreliella tachyglossi]
MNDLNLKKKKFEKILSIKTYDKRFSEIELMNINNQISEITEFVGKIPERVKKLSDEDTLLRGYYLDYLNSKKKEELKNISKLKYEYKKYYDVYLKKYREEKKINILIKGLNDTIIIKKEKKESLLLDEYINYKICKKLGINDE